MELLPRFFAMHQGSLPVEEQGWPLWRSGRRRWRGPSSVGCPWQQLSGPSCGWSGGDHGDCAHRGGGRDGVCVGGSYLNQSLLSRRTRSLWSSRSCRWAMAALLLLCVCGGEERDRALDHCWPSGFASGGLAWLVPCRCVCCRLWEDYLHCIGGCYQGRASGRSADGSGAALGRLATSRDGVHRVRSLFDVTRSGIAGQWGDRNLLDLARSKIAGQWQERNLLDLARQKIAGQWRGGSRHWGRPGRGVLLGAAARWRGVVARGQGDVLPEGGACQHVLCTGGCLRSVGGTTTSGGQGVLLHTSRR